MLPSLTGPAPLPLPLPRKSLLFAGALGTAPQVSILCRTDAEIRCRRPRTRSSRTTSPTPRANHRMTNPFNPCYRAEKEAQEQHALGALQDVITAPVDDVQVHTATATATRRWDRCDNSQPEYAAPPPSLVTAGTWPHVNWSGGGGYSSRWAQPPLRSVPLHRSPPPPPKPPKPPKQTPAAPKADAGNEMMMMKLVQSMQRCSNDVRTIVELLRYRHLHTSDRCLAGGERSPLPEHASARSGADAALTSTADALLQECAAAVPVATRLREAAATEY